MYACCLRHYSRRRLAHPPGEKWENIKTEGKSEKPEKFGMSWEKWKKTEKMEKIRKS